MADYFSLTHGPERLLVESAVPQTLEFARRLLGPGIVVEPCVATRADTPNVEISRGTEAEGAEVLARAQKMPRLAVGTNVHYTILSSSPSRVELLKGDQDGSGLLWVESEPARERLRVRVFGEGPGAARGICRLLKVFVLGSLQKRQLPMIHGSVAALDDDACLFLGPTASGKSSLMYLSCSRLGARFVSDDLATVWRDHGGTMRISGWPNRLAIGLSVFKADPVFARMRFSELRRPFFAHGNSLARRASAEELASAVDGWSQPTRVRIHFDPDEFLSFFGFEGASASKPRLLVLPSADKSEGHWTIRRPNRARAAELLQANLAARRQMKYSTDVLGLMPKRDSDQDSELWRELRELPLLEVVYGPAVNERFAEFMEDLKAAAR